jgi:hypothetical protein
MWEQSGLLPPAPLRLVRANPNDRIYPLELVEALEDVAANEKFGRRRPSEFWKQRHLMH